MRVARYLKKIMGKCTCMCMFKRLLFFVFCFVGVMPLSGAQRVFFQLLCPKSTDGGNYLGEICFVKLTKIGGAQCLIACDSRHGSIFYRDNNSGLFDEQKRFELPCKECKTFVCSHLPSEVSEYWTRLEEKRRDESRDQRWKNTDTADRLCRVDRAMHLDRLMRSLFKFNSIPQIHTGYFTRDVWDKIIDCSVYNHSHCEDGYEIVPLSGVVTLWRMVWVEKTDCCC